MALALGALGISSAAAARPNIIVVISDDQGYGDLGCHGNPVVRTPHLDRWHAQSVRFTDFHVSPMCTPTRGQLMTGLDALRNGAMNVSSGRALLRPGCPTLPEHLRQAGYATGLFGKWHLGDNHPFRPQDRGFDESLWFPSSIIGSLPDAWNNDYFDDRYRRGAAWERHEGYTTDVFFREAMRWMKAQKTAGRPFFTYLATAAAHEPLYVPAACRAAVRPRLEAARPKLPPLSAREEEKLVRFLAMIENLDENIGRLEAFLEAENLRDDTLVVFLTDNGSTLGEAYYNAGMRGRKTTLWEGGHRVPLFVRWPRGGLGPARDEPTLTHVQDVLPTLLDLCGLPVPRGLDGHTLAPLLRRREPPPDRMLTIHYSRMPNPAHGIRPTPRKEGAAVLWRQWRWLEHRALYDVAADPAQQHDVAAAHPEIARRLRDHLDAWWAGVAAGVDEPQRIVIGSPRENPLLLTACDWWDVFIDQQEEVRRGGRKFGVWHLTVAQAGDYQFELRRWPREIDLPLTAAAPAATLADGALPPGVALPIAKAVLRCGSQRRTLELAAEARHATFQLRLPAGPIELEAVFQDGADRPIAGAYYVWTQALFLPGAPSAEACQTAPSP